MWRCSVKLLARLTGSLFLVAATALTPALAADFDLAKLKEGGYVVLLRHVKAGGVDADDFDLANCRTQRQVGAPGRAQAEVLKARFQAAGITDARVLTSQWCRARETAELLGFGPVIEETGLNYFHWKLGSESEMNARLKRYFEGLQAPPTGPPLILVSHKPAFVAIGQEPPPSGGGLVLMPNGSAAPQVVGTITAPE